jgi:hypothetical protein
MPISIAKAPSRVFESSSAQLQIASGSEIRYRAEKRTLNREDHHLQADIWLFANQPLRYGCRALGGCSI